MLDLVFDFGRSAIADPGARCYVAALSNHRDVPVEQVLHTSIVGPASLPIVEHPIHRSVKDL